MTHLILKGKKNKPNHSQFPYESARKSFIMMFLCDKGRKISMNRTTQDNIRDTRI